MKKTSDDISGLQPYLKRILERHEIKTMEELFNAYPGRLMSFHGFGFTSLRRVEEILPGKPHLERIGYSWGARCRCDYCASRAAESKVKIKNKMPSQSIPPFRAHYSEFIKEFRINANTSIIDRSIRHKGNLILQLSRFIFEQQNYLSEREILMLTKVGGRLYKGEKILK